MMKILHIKPGLSSIGGIESLIVALANDQAKAYDVRVCDVFEPLSDGVFSTRLSHDVIKETLHVMHNGFSIKNLLKIFFYLRKTDADIIHIHCYFYYFALPVIFLHHRLNFIYTIHSDAYMENTKWDKMILWLKRFCFQRKWVYPVTISEVSKESFCKLYHTESRLITNGLAIPPVAEHPNLIDETKVTSQTRVFMHPARIIEVKNQIVLCEVFWRLIEEGNDVALIIAGPICTQEVYDIIKTFFCDRIKYIGERNDIPELLSRSDGLCLPSLWEGLPMVLLESLAVGCIPICSPVGGIVNVISDGYNGLLSHSPSAEDYYAEMKRFLSMNYEDCSKMRNNAIESFEPYSISHTTDGYLSYYSDVINKKQISK